MISVKEAENLILKEKFIPQIKAVPLGKGVGHYLAEEIIADRPFPPFDRVTLDGIAINFESYRNGQRELETEFIHLAGEPQGTLKDIRNCVEIMTGSIMPINADSIIPYEELEKIEKGFRIKSKDVKKGQNIHFRGQDQAKGDLILKKSTQISPAESGIAASVGIEEFKILVPPPIAIIATGNELVPIAESPLAHQVRISNAYSLSTALSYEGYDSEIFHFPDSEEILKKELKSILERFKVLIIIGGASKGKADLVPKILNDLGIKKEFHGVAQRPGKPFWFGKGNENFVFGLPGNPVSSFLCFYRFIRPWIHLSLGGEFSFQKMTLGKGHKFEKPLTLFLQGKKYYDDGFVKAQPIQGGGSGDLTNLAKIDGFIELPAEKNDFVEGDKFHWIPFR